MVVRRNTSKKGKDDKGKSKGRATTLAMYDALEDLDWVRDWLNAETNHNFDRSAVNRMMAKLCRRKAENKQLTPQDFIVKDPKK